MSSWLKGSPLRKPAHVQAEEVRHHCQFQNLCFTLRLYNGNKSQVVSADLFHSRSQPLTQKKKYNPTIKREKCRVPNRKPLTHNVIRPPLNYWSRGSSDTSVRSWACRKSHESKLGDQSVHIRPATLHLLKRHFTCSHTSLFFCFHAAFAYLHLFSSSVAVRTEWK